MFTRNYKHQIHQSPINPNHQTMPYLYVLHSKGKGVEWQFCYLCPKDLSKLFGNESHVFVREGDIFFTYQVSDCDTVNEIPASGDEINKYIGDFDGLTHVSMCEVPTGDRSYSYEPHVLVLMTFEKSEFAHRVANAHEVPVSPTTSDPVYFFERDFGKLLREVGFGKSRMNPGSEPHTAISEFLKKEGLDDNVFFEKFKDVVVGLPHTMTPGCFRFDFAGDEALFNTTQKAVKFEVYQFAKLALLMKDL
jgi:hypothetical protein